MKISSYYQKILEKSIKNVYNIVAIMRNSIKDRLKDVMQERGIKVPALSSQTGIPKDRIYAWYRDNTEPKAEDRERLLKWMGEEIEKSLQNKTPTINELSAWIEVLKDVAAETISATSGESVTVVRMRLEKAKDEVLKLG